MNKVVLVGTIPKEGKDSFYKHFEGKLEVVEAANAAADKMTALFAKIIESL